MVHELSTTDAGACRTDAGQDSLKLLIASLVKLKSNIERVEAQLPSLGNELSSLCETAIDHLIGPDDGEMPMEPAPISTLAPENEVKQGVLCRPEAISLKRPNHIAAAFDSAGECLTKGLDRMGDGIIYVFEKLISLGSLKKKKPAESTPASIN